MATHCDPDGHELSSAPGVQLVKQAPLRHEPLGQVVECQLGHVVCVVAECEQVCNSPEAPHWLAPMAQSQQVPLLQPRAPQSPSTVHSAQPEAPTLHCCATEPTHWVAPTVQASVQDGTHCPLLQVLPGGQLPLIQS